LTRPTNDLASELTAARAECDACRIKRLETALRRLVQWSEAYPLDLFPEPNWKRAQQALEAAGITLDGISASCMRHVVEGVGRIAREALADAGDAPIMELPHGTTG
jgi:hypothetical protein